MGNLKLAGVKMANFTLVIRNCKEMQQFNLAHIIIAIKQKLNILFSLLQQAKNNLLEDFLINPHRRAAAILLTGNLSHKGHKEGVYRFAG